MSVLLKAGSGYPCGPCELPLKCSSCDTVITEENAVYKSCDGDDCETCQYCSNQKCPKCGAHVCCGGCV